MGITMAVTFSDVLTTITTALSSIWTMFGQCATMITSNMLIFVPVILAFMLSLVSVALIVFKKLGVRGLGGGRRRRRR